MLPSFLLKRVITFLLQPGIAHCSRIHPLSTCNYDGSYVPTKVSSRGQGRPSISYISSLIFTIISLNHIIHDINPPALKQTFNLTRSSSVNSSVQERITLCSVICNADVMSITGYKTIPLPAGRQPIQFMPKLSNNERPYCCVE